MVPPIFALVVAATAASPAEPPPRMHGVYVQVGPVGVAQPVLTSWFGFPGFTWGVGVGWRYREGRVASVLGLDLTHEVFSPREYIDGDEGPSFSRRGHLFSALPTLRLGTVRRVFAYGLLGAGLAVHASKVVEAPDRALGRETDAGLGLRLGFGVQGLVRRRVSVGGELSGELQSFRKDGDFAAYFLEPYANLADFAGDFSLRLGIVVSWGL